MNIENLNQAFIEIIEKKSTLSLLVTGSATFLTRQKQIDILEQSFLQTYGRYLEEVLFNVYDEYCPDNEILPLPAYFTSSYDVDNEGSSSVYEASPGNGVSVDADDFPGIKAKLVLVPNPIRMVLLGEKESFKEVVWSADRVLES